MNKVIEEALERQFPKGHTARSEALVLHAIAQIELEKVIKNCMENFIDVATDAIRNLTDDKTYVLRMALQRITMEHIDEVEENAGSIWYRVGKQWYFVMTAECDK